MQTLLLDTVTWDLTIDAQRNIAMASEPYAIAQDVASAARLFRGECYYNTIKGIPYFEQVLGHSPPIGLVKSLLNTAAMTVPLVISSQTFIIETPQREVQGQIQVRSTSGISVVVVPLAGPGEPGGAFIISVSAIGQGAV
jgi:hypothetical protein